MQANAGPRGPTQANTGPQRPTKTHKDPQRPTKAQRRPTQAHKDPQRPTKATAGQKKIRNACTIAHACISYVLSFYFILSKTCVQEFVHAFHMV